MSAYYVKVYDGKVIEFILERDGKNKYLIGNHRFLIRSDGNASPDKYQNIIFMIDGRDIVPTITTWTYLSHSSYGFLNIGTCTHAYIGAVNLDGRFITGDIAMKVFNYLFVVGADAWDIMDDNTQTIDRYLEDNELPDFGDDYYDSGIYALQCLETSGQHVFALSPRGMYAEKPRFYGLRLNNYLFKQPQSHF
jgi:hypothetical protein